MAAGERPWRTQYGPNVRADIETASFPTLGAFCRATAAVYGNAPAFTNVLPNGMNGTLTFAQVDEMSDAFARYLRDVAELRPGDRVALQMPNCLTFPVAAFGVLKAGCVLVNVNPLYTRDEMARLFTDAIPKALVIIDMFADKVPAATAGHQIPHVIVTRVAEFLPSLPRGIVGLVQRYWDQTVRPIPYSHIRFPEALAAGRAVTGDAQRYDADITPESIACLQYTGGTTGVAKGAMLSHANLLLNMEQTYEMLEGIEKGKEVALTALPLYHIFAFTVNMLAFYWLGARNILIANPRPLSNLRRAFENYRITWMSGVNTLFNALCNETWFTDSPPRHLKFSSAGGMALQSAVAARFEEITGKPLLQGYGLTETSPVLTFNPLGKSRDGSIGIPVPGTDMTCLDDAGAAVPQGEAGELAAKGPQIMSGYWNKPGETDAVLSDGWFRTGDIGVMDEDGYFRIVDRKKDLIVVSGFNVYPNEVEECLSSHPDVIECAVIGVPDQERGEAPKAFVVRASEHLTEADVRAFCKEHLSPYKVPRQVAFREALPKSNVGKILRKELRDPPPSAPQAEPSRG